jgi:diguanylate cyclase (GGDEF)-like protein
MDFAMLLAWWAYLYVFVVIPWQYVSPDQQKYGISFDVLYAVEHAAILTISGASWLHSRGGWRAVYRGVFLASLVYALASLAASVAIDFGTYHTGSAFDIPLLVALGMFVQVPAAGGNVTSVTETRKEAGDHSASVTAVANAATLSLPLLGIWAAYSSPAPDSVRQFRLVLTLAAIFVIGTLRSVKQHQLQRRLAGANKELQDASMTDPLTGVRNRRFFVKAIESDVRQVERSYVAQRSRRQNRDLIFYLIDIDHFKEVNDRFGHDEGDRLLVQIAFRISSAIRHSDVLIRWGGEEFLVVSRFTTRTEAAVLCGRILTAIGGEAYELRNGSSVSRTCSIGWAPFPWIVEQPERFSWENVMKLADEALYEAKRSGRNQGVGILAIPNLVYAVSGLDDFPRLPKGLARTMGPKHREFAPMLPELSTTP